MTPVFVTRLTIAACLLSAVVEAALVCNATTSMSLMDAPIVLFIVGPYLCLALVAWLQRGKLAASWAILAIALGLAGWGLYILGEDSYRYHTDANYRKLQRMAAFFVPLTQYVAVALAGTASLFSYLSSLENRPTTEVGPGDARERRESRQPGS